MEKRATWLELFYDLIFVASFIQLGSGLSANVSLKGALAFAGAFIPLWVAWTGTTFFTNRYTVDDFLHRLLVFGQMIAVGGMGLTGCQLLTGERAGFSLSAAAAQAIVAVLHFRAYRDVPESRGYAAYWGMVFAGSSVLWVSAVWVPAPWTYGVWGLATLMVLGTPLSRYSHALTERFPIDFDHLSERYALLTLIVLGESFVKVLSALSESDQGLSIYMGGSALLFITCGLWWVYFDDIAGSHVKKGRVSWIVWLYAHIPLQVGITGVGVGIKKAMLFSWESPAAEKHRWLLAGFLCVVLLGVAAIDSVTERRDAQLNDRARVSARWISAVMVLVLAPAGASMGGGLFLVLVTGLVLAQVVFDMMMAPLQASQHAEVGKQSLADRAREVTRSGRPLPPRPRRDLSESIHKGAPSELRSDLYSFFMSGGWVRVFATLGVLFLLTNVFFAALYTLEDGAIGNGRPHHFADAFFFSVQTMSTIGYGSLFPNSQYGQLVATLEAAVSMIGVAIVTGFVFAKVSRARAGVLFSKPIIVTLMDGKPTLQMRVGNARGQEIVDASVDMFCMRDEVTQEGAHLRRLRDLKLARSRSPLFRLTWTIIHMVDESSPLHDVDWGQPGELMIGVTLIGHDGVYGQTTYARHFYAAEDIRVGHQFVDIVDQLDDGRLMIDYTAFHDTVEDSALRAQLEELSGK
jgi:low temperature requirement protein LtrA